MRWWGGTSSDLLGARRWVGCVVACVGPRDDCARAEAEVSIDAGYALRSPTWLEACLAAAVDAPRTVVGAGLLLAAFAVAFILARRPRPTTREERA